MEIRIEGRDLPGGVHRAVGVQVRKTATDLLGPVPANTPIAIWTVECRLVDPPAGTPERVDLRGDCIQGRPGDRFIYLSWVRTADGATEMFRRAKLMLAAVPTPVMAAASTSGLLLARLRLSDDKGEPLCAAVRPPRIEWTAGS